MLGLVPELVPVPVLGLGLVPVLVTVGHKPPVVMLLSSRLNLKPIVSVSFLPPSM